MRIVDFSLSRRVTVSMVAVALVLFGLVAFDRLPINLLPDLSYPTLTVETRYPGTAPAEVEALVTRPIEEVVGIVAGVRRLTSASKPGLSQVSLEFGWGRDMDFAALDVRQKLDLLALPEQSDKPVLLRFDPANDPVMRLYLRPAISEDGETALAADLFQMRYVAEEVLKKDLESTEGVAAIKINGGFEEEIEVKVDEGKLSLLGLSIQDIDDRLLRENVNQAGGSLYESEARYLVRARNEFEDLGDIRETIVLHVDGRSVSLGDVARIERGAKPREVVTRFGPEEAVELAIYKEGDANTVQVARAVNERLDSIEAEIPTALEIVTGLDQSRFIRASIREVLMNALIGGAIAMLILLLFLKDPKSTLIIGVSIPISIVTTFFLMYRTGTSLNIMSLGGLALGVGMLVDNAIVVLEAIFKRREDGLTWLEAARVGAGSVGKAVVASTLTTVAVFLPVVFLQGVAAQLFRDMALTVSFSLLASLAVSLTLIPMLAATLSRDRRSDSGQQTGQTDQADPAAPVGIVRRVGRLVLVTIPGRVLSLLRIALQFVGRALAWIFRPLVMLFDGAMATLQSIYPKLLKAALRARPAVLAITLVLFAAAMWLVPSLGFDLIPSFAQGEFGFTIELPEGTPLEVTDRYVAAVTDTVADDPRIADTSAIVGGRGLALTNTGSEGENTARLQVRLAEGATPEDEAAVIAALRSRLEEQPEVRAELERPTYFTVRNPIEVEVYADGLDSLHQAAATVRERLEAVPGLVEITSSAELGNPELQIRFDRDQLSRLGLDLSAVSATVRNKVQGDVATRFTEGDREIDVVVRSVERQAASIDDVSNLIVGQRDGVPIYLKSIAGVSIAEGPSEIRRLGQKRAAVLSADLAGRDMGSAAAEVRTMLADLTLPAGVTATLSGQEEERKQAAGSMLLAMALAAFLVYLVMASQFESLLHPFVIIFTLPLGAVGVVLALALTGGSISVVALIGAVMLAGIVVNNAIVLIDSVNQHRAAGSSVHDALIAAGNERLRPILMTSATTILGLLPMALGLGEGAELRAPLAITVVGGLTVATGLTLIVIPVVYSLLERRTFPQPASEPEPTVGQSMSGNVVPNQVPNQLPETSS